VIRDGFFYAFVVFVPEICRKFTFISLFVFSLAVRIMYDKNSRRSRGFGFVHFSNDHEAKCAKDSMDE
jgi:RNA recognition motif-containing protein